MALAATLGEAPPKISMSDRPATKKFSARPLYQFNSCGGRADAAVGPVAPLLARRGTHSQYGTSERASAGGHAASVRVARLLPIPVLLSLLPSFLLSRLFGSLLLRLRKEARFRGTSRRSGRARIRTGERLLRLSFPFARPLMCMQCTTLHYTALYRLFHTACFASRLSHSSREPANANGLKKQMNVVKMQCISGKDSLISGNRRVVRKPVPLSVIGPSMESK